jgi:hypothetical protein
VKAWSEEGTQELSGILKDYGLWRKKRNKVGNKKKFDSHNNPSKYVLLFAFRKVERSISVCLVHGQVPRTDL